MENPPQFIKDFSKEESPDERQQAAQAIRAKRAEYFNEKNAQLEKLKNLQQTTTEREQTLDSQLELTNQLENEIIKISTSRLKEIISY